MLTKHLFLFCIVSLGLLRVKVSSLFLPFLPIRHPFYPSRYQNRQGEPQSDRFGQMENVFEEVQLKNLKFSFVGENSLTCTTLKMKMLETSKWTLFLQESLEISIQTLFLQEAFSMGLGRLPMSCEYLIFGLTQSIKPHYDSERNSIFLFS